MEKYRNLNYLENELEKYYKHEEEKKVYLLTHLLTYSLTHSLLLTHLLTHSLINRLNMRER